MSDSAPETTKIEKADGYGMIVCWPVPPELAQALVLDVEGALAPEDMHVTIKFLGDASANDPILVLAAAKMLAVRTPPLEATVSGYGRFATGGEEDPIVALVDSKELQAWKRELEFCLMDSGVEVREDDHGFTPHITLAWVPRGTEVVPPYINAAGKIEKVAVWWNGINRIEMNLEGTYPEPCDPCCCGDCYACAKAARKADIEEPAPADPDLGELDYVVKAANTEERYTFGPLYAPDRVDAHGDYVQADELQKAVWGYVRDSAEKGRRLNLQHEDSGWSTCGEWVEIVSWPYETVVKLRLPGEEERELVMPAGTVFMGVKWDEDAWEAVKAGKIGGLSMGGTAVRVKRDADLPDMGDQTTPRT